MKELCDDALSLQTCNHALRAIQSFSRWLWKDGRSREDTLVHLNGVTVAVVRRHDRCAFAAAELRRLIDIATAGSDVHGMTGRDRAILYRLAVATGFRANELRSLTPKSFDLASDPPFVSVKAPYSKRCRDDVRPIRTDLATAVRGC